MEVFEPSVKQPRPPRPAKQQPNAQKKPGDAKKSAPKQQEPVKAPTPEAAPVKQPPAVRLPEAAHLPQLPAAKPSKPPVRKYRSDPFAPPGRVVAFADGRRSRNRSKKP